MLRRYAFLLGWLIASDAHAAATAARDAEGDRFAILEYRVLGNSTLPAASIETAVYPFLGPGRNLADVQQAARALEQAYRDAGYNTVYVDIPEQDVDAGVIRLKVTEGRIAEVGVKGSRYFSNRRIRAAVPSLSPGAVPHFPTLQAELETVNRLSADLKVTPVLKAGARPGTVDVELKAEDSLPVHGSFEVNDRYTADTTQTRAAVTLSYDNLFRRPHNFSLQYQTAPEATEEASVLAATYVARDPESGRTLALYGVDSDSDVATVGTLSVIGKGWIVGTRYILPLVARPESSIAVSLGADYKDFAENVRLDEENSLETPISYLNLSVVLSGSRNREQWQANWSAGPRFGVRGLFNDEQEFADKRYLGRPNYVYLAADGQYRHSLPGKFGVQLRATGQYSVEPLVSNEQFSFGGATSVRGYLESEELADYGIAGTLELLSPPLFASLEPQLREFYALAFVDAGIGALQQPLPDQEPRYDLSSVGLGLRISAFGGLEAALDWAYPLVTGSHTREGDDRFHFLVRYGF